MRIPSGGSSNGEATTYGPNIDYGEVDEPEAESRSHKPRSHGRFRKTSAARSGLEDAPNGAAAQREEGEEYASPLAERSKYCPRGKAFYRCANGFIGCCSHDPCNPGETCRDGQNPSHQKETTKSATHDQKSTQHVTTTHSQPWPHPLPTSLRKTEQSTSTKSASHSDHDSLKSSKTSIMTASPTSSSATPTAPSTGSTPPACPGGNGTHYTDSTKVKYEILCGMENTFPSYNAIWFGDNGYSKCFSACSGEEKCAGFTFVGTEHGNCYQKTQMPNNTYVLHDGNTYVSGTKVNSPHNTGTGQKSSPKKAGIIAGSVIGTIILPCLLVFLIICCAKRRRKKIDERHAATITHVLQGPIEMQPYRPPTDQQRQGSTSHDFLSNSGGNTPGYFDTPAKQRSQVGNASPPALVGLEQTFREEADPEIRPESGFIPMILPTPTYQSSQTPSGSRSPHLNDQLQGQHGGKSNSGASTIDSPTLGQQIVYNNSLTNDMRRNQHLARGLPPRNTPSPKGSPPTDASGNRWREL